MNPDTPLQLLGGRTPADFMRRYWQRKPLLIRQAIPAFRPPLTIAGIKRLARNDDVEARLIWRENGAWQMEHGPFARLPKAGEPGWTLLVQGVDLHDDAAAALMQQFRFIPDARLDDIMISIATDGGGVGPHFDSYDVFLLQAVGQRDWRIGRQRDLSLEPGLPLRILRDFRPEENHVLAPGDMLYLPPQVAHDGIALGDCMTISIGFRSPSQAVLARGMLEAAAEQVLARAGQPAGPYAEPPLPGPDLQGVYRDPGQPAVAQPAALPESLVDAALAAVGKLRFDQALATRFLGCWLTEPAANAVFDGLPPEEVDLATAWPAGGRLVLDRRSRMLYRQRQLFVNGEVAPVPASTLMRRLADDRAIDCASARPSAAEQDLLAEWLDDGWLRYVEA
ncbi:cupin domain-containing protein [Achromobacter aloeverae]|uniref:Cupin n=1 Tax=Achromobacter aloeverae TaxID=1750518 RepID=A0A4Q1HSS0_9BURK|nr:cupin domain-containing protein [Achromobacter aloeverae]RXN93336.1 cupin [Achromobacter aloeverae]